MIQGRSRLRFALEPAEGLRVFRNLVRQELQGDKAVQLYVLGLVDHTHPATAEFFDNAKMRNGLANKRIGAGHAQHILGRDMSQVNEPSCMECVLS